MIKAEKVREIFMKNTRWASAPFAWGVLPFTPDRVASLVDWNAVAFELNEEIVRQVRAFSDFPPSSEGAKQEGR